MDAVPARPGARLSGTLPVVAATVIAGIGAYVIMLIAPTRLSTNEYTAFAVFWSTIYFVTASLVAIQNEISRASYRVPKDTPVHGPTLRTFSLWIIAAVVAVAAVLIAFSGPALFGESVLSLAWPFLLAIGGYVLAAVIGGVLFGLHLWGYVGLAILVDTVTRIVLVVPALLLGADATALAWLVAIPFAVAPLIVWIAARHRVVGRIGLDVSYRVLVRNILLTLPGAVAAALLGTGLPALLKLMPDADPAVIAPLIFAATVGRAPFATLGAALQGFLIVRFRDARPSRTVGVIVLVFALGVAVVAVAAWLWGPWLIETLVGRHFVLDGAVLAWIVASGGLIGLMYASGAALLGAGRHWWQSAGWVLAVVVAAALMLPAWGAFESRVVVGLVSGPVAGLAAHAIGLLVAARRSARIVAS